VKHGHGKNIAISLRAEGDGLALTIRDDGVGLPADVRNSVGMGLHIMNYRAKMIGATLQVQPGSRDGNDGRNGRTGTVVTCKLQSLST
jgi:signal transduction histidine kinase